MKKQRKVAESGHAGESQPAPGQEATAPSGPGKSERLPPRQPGRFRFDLLLLIAIVLVINIPFLAGRCMPAHDTKGALGIFDYFYSNYLFAGELPRWMAYGLYGLDATVSHVTFMSGASYLAMFAGKILSVQDSLFLFTVSICLEQLLLLLGLYLLCRRLFQERLTVFCICLTMVCTVMWQSQISLNLRLYYLLPLEFYFILRLRQEEKGCFGWLAGLVAVLGPLGSAPYFYPFWALLVTVFSVALFWGNFRALKCMLRPQWLNLAAAIIFVVIAAAFAGSVSKASDNLAYLSRDRQGASGNVSLGSFVTYGGNDLGDMWESLLLPSANVADFSGRMGMTDYVGLLTLLCLPLAFLSLRKPTARSFAILALALFALSRGGLLASVAYYFPGMHLFRHVGYMTAVIKLVLLVLAGFGLDTLVGIVRERKLAQYANGKMLFLALLAVVFYLDFYIGGRVWGDALGAPPPPPGPVAVRVIPSVVFPLLRAVLLVVFILAVWSSCRPAKNPAIQKPNLAMFFLLALLIGDSALFQSEIIYLLHPASERIEFPAIKLSTQLERSDQINSDEMLKYQAWTKAPGTEYQLVDSSTMQWDPLLTRFRVDLFPANVKKVMDILIRSDTNDFVAVCKPKFRLLTQSTRVATDDQGLALLESQTGWDTKVLLTGAGNDEPPSLNPALESEHSTLNVDNFSANSLSLSISNSFPDPAWLVYSDAYTPGWHAIVNGTPAPVVEAYTAFKAVRLQSGNSTVRFYYDNGLPSTCLSVFAVLAGCAAAVGLAALAWLAVKEPFTG